MTSGHRKLFQDQMKDRMTLVAMAGLVSGMMMRNTIIHSGTPSMRAASTSDLGMA